MLNRPILTLLLLALLCTCGPALKTLHAQADIAVSHPVDFISKFQDINVAADGTGFVVGICGVMRQTNTDGQMWETVAPPSDMNFSTVACPPGTCDVALLGATEGLYRLSNGSWTSVDVGETSFDGTLHWLTNSLVIHENSGDKYHRSTDAGLTWTELALPDFQRGNMVFIDADNFFVWVGMELYKSTDGGLTFNSVGYTHPESIRRQAWLNDQQGWIFSGDRLFHGTTDGGQTWTVLNETSQLTSVNWFEVLSPTHLVGAQITTSRLESLDGGVTWARTSFLPAGNHRVNERYHRRGNEFFTVGDASQLLYSPAGFTDFVELDPFERNGTVRRLAAYSNDEAYAVVSREVLVTTNGVDWNVAADFPFNITDLVTLPDGRAVILSSSATKITADNGATFTDWVPTDLVPQSQFGEVFSEKPNGDYYLLGSDYASQSTDGGNNWTAINHATELSFNGMQWISNDIGYAFTRQEHFAKTTDGGQSWVVGDGPVTNLEGIYFLDEMNGWVSRANDRYVTADGGATWTTGRGEGGYAYQDHPTDGSILVARYLSGNNGEISRSTDGGETWRSLNYNCFAYRAGAVSPDGKYFWTGGDGGFIVRHDLEELITLLSPTFGRTITYDRLQAFPNPADQLVTVEFPQMNNAAQLGIIDAAGRVLSTKSIAAGLERTTVNLDKFPAGVYTLRWTAGERIGRVRVVKR